jgi:flavin reductase (DIM6/NTAB) family NADH-FMN oxidoreductase RutF
MIEACPVNLKCSLDKVIDNGPRHELFIGDIVSTYTEEKYLMDRVVDIKKAKPFILSLADWRYYVLGELKAKAWNAGKTFKT